jgi:hypothetical protein
MHPRCDQLSPRSPALLLSIMFLPDRRICQSSFYTTTDSSISRQLSLPLTCNKIPSYSHFASRQSDQFPAVRALPFAYNSSISIKLPTQHRTFYPAVTPLLSGQPPLSCGRSIQHSVICSTTNLLRGLSYISNELSSQHSKSLFSVQLSQGLKFFFFLSRHQSGLFQAFGNTIGGS